MTDFDAESIIDMITGDFFEGFKAKYTINCFYELNPKTIVRAVRNAETEIKRVGEYHSSTGADTFRQAAIIGKWLADMKPIQVDIRHPINLTNEQSLDAAKINSTFAARFICLAIINERIISDELSDDLVYCFEFRSSSMPAEAIALILKHQPRT